MQYLLVEGTDLALREMVEQRQGERALEDVFDNYKCRDLQGGNCLSHISSPIMSSAAAQRAMWIPRDWLSKQTNGEDS